MVADNNLDYFAVQDINEMEKVFAVENNKLFVYVDRGRKGVQSHPYLLEIAHDTTDLIVSFTERRVVTICIYCSD